LRCRAGSLRPDRRRRCDQDNNYNRMRSRWFLFGDKWGGRFKPSPRQNCPTGNWILIDRNRVKRKIAENQKYFAFTEMRPGLYSLHPVPTRGASAIVTNEGRGCDGRGSALGEGRRSVRQRRVVLTSHGWRRRWQQYMAHRGERVISRKAIAQGMPDVLRCPVCSCAHFYYSLRMRPRVQRASGIPCALWIWGRENFFQSSGAMRREKARVRLVIRHPEVRALASLEG